MNYLIFGNSHLHAFKEAFNRSWDHSSVPVFIPTPNLENLDEIVSGQTSIARLKFGDIKSQLEIPSAIETTLVIVGNGNFGHFSTFEIVDTLPPLWVFNSTSCCDLLPEYPPVSRALFNAYYSRIASYHLFDRFGFTVDFFNKFFKVIIFASPTPARSFFERQRFSSNYLQSLCLQSFKSSYSSLFRQRILDLGVRNCRISLPSSRLENLDGTTACEYLLDERLQVHANTAYWIQRIYDFQS